MPKICGLLAEKPTNLSKAMHLAGYKALSIDFDYLCFDTLDTASSLQEMRAKAHRGYSLTIPHKESAMELVDELSESAKKIGAINTVVNSSGRLKGYNTDCQPHILCVKFL